MSNFSFFPNAFFQFEKPSLVKTSLTCAVGEEKCRQAKQNAASQLSEYSIHGYCLYQDALNDALFLYRKIYICLSRTFRRGLRYVCWSWCLLVPYQFGMQIYEYIFIIIIQNIEKNTQWKICSWGKNESELIIFLHYSYVHA